MAHFAVGTVYCGPLFDSRAYISLRRKTIQVGSCHRLRPPTPQFRIGDTNMLESKNAKIGVTPKAKQTICVTPNVKPHFMFVLISFVLVTQCQPCLQWNMGFKESILLQRKTNDPQCRLFEFPIPTKTLEDPMQPPNNAQCNPIIPSVSL